MTWQVGFLFYDRKTRKKPMTHADAEAEKQNSGSRLEHVDHAPKQSGRSAELSAENARISEELESLPEGEKELFRELIQALRTIRYGSIVLTVHDGQVVEINKSIRIRKSRAGTKG
jgi:hypothetical protein